MMRILLSVALLLALAPMASAEPIPLITPTPLVIDTPLLAPLDIDVTVNPVITIGGSTIDVLSFSNLPVFSIGPIGALRQQTGPETFVFTTGFRASLGLASLTIVPRADNRASYSGLLPTFTPGTTDLLVFSITTTGFPANLVIWATNLQGEPGGVVLGAIDPATVPEPASLLLLGTGLVGLSRKRR